MDVLRCQDLNFNLFAWASRNLEGERGRKHFERKVTLGEGDQWEVTVKRRCSSTCSHSSGSGK